MLNLWLRNYDIAQANAQEVLELAQEHRFHVWNAVGLCLHGAALVAMNSTDEGLPQIQQGLKDYQTLRTPPVFWPLLLHLCAGAYGMASSPKQGLSLMDAAIEAALGSTAKTFRSEFLLLKGELLVAVSSQNMAEAESLYQEAVNNARAVHAPLLELRAALRLSSLWPEQGKKEEARKLLSDAYTKIHEGFTTHDMLEASALLANLSE